MTVLIDFNEREQFVEQIFPVSIKVKIQSDEDEDRIIAACLETFGVEATDYDHEHSKWSYTEGARWDYAIGDEDDVIYYFQNEHDACLFKLML